MLLKRNTLKAFVTLAKQVIGKPSRGLAPRVCFTELGGEFKMTVSLNDRWLENTETGEFDLSQCSLPWDAVAEIANAKTKELTVAMEQQSNRVEWTADGQDVCREFSDGPSGEHEPFPEAETMKTMDSRLFPSLREAMLTTDSESTRYALACVCLRGQKKDLAATDSRQLLIQRGFDWPWDEDLLIPASRCCQSAALRKAAETGPIEIGRTAEHVVLRIGCWRIALPIETEARYPNIDLIVPHMDDYGTTLLIEESDREFLANQLHEQIQPDSRFVTVDLNGAVAIRASDSEESPGKELILSNSRRDGAEITIDSDYRYLLRAGDFGLSQIKLSDEKSPLVARNDQYTYVWMGLTGNPAPRPHNVEQVVSPPANAVSPQTKAPSTRKTNDMSHDKNNGTPIRSASKNVGDAADADSVDLLIDQATALKGKLKDLQSEMQELINSLRTQKKQAKIVRNTIDSLQKLNSLQA